MSRISVAGIWRSPLFASPISIAASISLLIVAILAVAGPLLAPYDPLQFHGTARLQGPSAQFWFGTDQFGRDILSRILAGASASIFFGIAATAIGTVLGTIVG